MGHLPWMTPFLVPTLLLQRRKFESRGVVKIAAFRARHLCQLPHSFSRQDPLFVPAGSRERQPILTVQA